MQTVSSLADRLGMTPELAVEKLRYMLIEVEGAEAEISDDACDLLIEAADDPEAADRVRNAKLLEQEKVQKRTERLKEAARKKAAAKKKADEAAETQKPVAKKKAAARGKEGEVDAVEAPAGDDSGHAVAEIIRDESSEVVVEEPAPVPVPEVEVEAAPPKAPEPKKKQPEKPKAPEIVIGSAVERVEPVVEVVRADGTHVPAAQAEAILEATAVHPLAEIEEEEETSPVFAEAERRQEEEEERKAQLIAKPLAKPDPAVVAEVQRRAAERIHKLQQQRALESRKVGHTGKTARKRQKQAEKQRTVDTMRRNAAAAVREYQASGIGMGPRKRKRRRTREDMPDMEGVEDISEIQVIQVEEGMTVEALANELDLPVNDIILDLMDLNILANKNQVLGIDMIRQIVEPRGIQVEAIIPGEDEVLAEEPDAPEDLRPRAPVVTVMGHVDHGKTSLLDRVREANVAGGEAGGITQHIAAYDHRIGDKRVVFLDTPGHEAFTQMRSRCAQITDIVVLVVAADDGVMPQTIEAIDHAKAADVPIVVAINKCDKPDAQPERIRQELTRFELLDEAWGGKTIIKNISAKLDQGVGELMELLVLEAEMLELKGNPNKRGRGVVVESEISRGQGPAAWLLVKNGTLRVGDAFLAGQTYGRVRSMHNSRGESILEAGPATPVVVTGFNVLPDAGDQFVAVQDERVARIIAEKRADIVRQKQRDKTRRVTLEDFHLLLEAGDTHELNVVLKADVQGSVDVLESSFSKVGNQEVHVRLVHSGVGGINESDVLLASASNAVILGFHVTASPRAQKLAEQEGVDVRTYRVIYEAIEDVRLALEGLLTPESREVVTGHIEIRQVFRSSAHGNIAGCYVLDGEVHRGSPARVSRDNVVVYQGKIGTLRREKDDARTVAAGFECGLKLENFEDIKIGDIIELYRVDSVAKTLA